MTLVADAMRAGMAPASRSELRTSLLKFLGPYTRNVSTDSLDDEVGMFVAALAGLPLWTVRQALLNWLQAKIPDCSAKFVPKPPELRQEAERIARSRRLALGSIDAVLAAEVPAPITDEEREACLKRAAETVEGIVKAGEKLDAELSDASAAAARIEQAAYVERFRRAEAERKARIARLASDAPERAREDHHGNLGTVGGQAATSIRVSSSSESTKTEHQTAPNSP